MTFQQILASLQPGSRSWIEVDSVTVYIRVTEHYIAGARRSTIDIANVQVSEGKRLQGRFSTLLLDAESAAAERDIEAVYVESVLNLHLRGALERRGYLREGSNPGFQCYYKLTRL